MGEEFAWGDTGMIRLGISVEGKTERNFVSTVLKPHLEQFGVTVVASPMHGNISLDRVKHELKSFVHGFDHVSTFYDYYKFVRAKGRTVSELETAMLEGLEQSLKSKITPYIQMYEFEALLFAVPDKVTELLRGKEKQTNLIRDAVKECGSPEAVNKEFDTKPSARLGRIFPGYENQKDLFGAQILREAGLATVREGCPRFSVWITQLEQLGQQAA